MPFPCPGCGSPVAQSPEAWALRCPACAAVLRSRPVEGGAAHPTYEIEVAGRPDTRRRVEVPWDEAQRRRLAAWLLWASLVTVGLVVLLYALARWTR